MKEAKVTDDAAAESGEAISKRQAYREKRKGSLLELDTKLEQLRTKASQITTGARRDIDEGFESLNRKRKRFVDKMSALRDASGDAWDELKTGADNSWDELEEAFGDFRRGVSSALARIKGDSKS